MTNTATQILADFPKKDYPWNVWLDGNTRVLVRGTHFDPDPQSMRVTVYRAASRMGRKVRTVIDGDQLIIKAKD
tara:strand:- start:2140 stop:2361 length:222 start_codon:yes stop_codon:yes gene_type:complete